MDAGLGPTVLENAVVEVDEGDAVTLHLGEPVAHVVAAHPGMVMRVLLDYTATVGRDLTVLTRHRDGRRAIHRLHPDGTATRLRPPSASPPIPLDDRIPRRVSIARHGLKALEGISRVRRGIAGAWAASRKWLVAQGLWLMLGVEVLALVGILTFILVTMAPYLWTAP